LLWGRDQLFVRNSVALASLQSNHATLTIYGAYADWRVEQWRFIGAGYMSTSIWTAPRGMRASSLDTSRRSASWRIN